MNRLFATVLLLGAVCAPVQAVTPPDDQASLRKVVETFRVSLIKKDPVSFMRLFYSDTIPWIGVTTDKSLARWIAEKKNPSQPDPGKLDTGGNPKSFIEAMSSSQNAIEEKIDNLRIDTDGDVAQIWFDYRFNVNDYTSNWGKEAWHLVRTADGWKISSVIWSMERNPLPPPKWEQPKR